MTYLDYNATAPVRPEARAAVAAALEALGNPSSIHAHGRAQRRRLEDAREDVAALAGGRPQDVIFTSGGTEANALGIRGAARARVLVSAGEHDCVLAAVPGAERVPLTAEGVIDLAALEAMLSADERPALLALMLANNETGVIQPVAEAVTLAKARGVRVHCDGVQAAGKIPVDITALGVDSLALSAHKLGGPPGVGALVLRQGVAIEAQARGGGQERRRRAGTENLPAIAGFAAAARTAAADLERMAGLDRWRDDMETALSEIAPEILIFGRGVPRLPTTSCIALPGWPAERQLMALDLAGVSVSSGSACSSGKVEPSHVLTAMGVEPAIAGTALRISLGWDSRAEDAERFVAVWGDLYRRRMATAGGEMKTLGAA